MKLSFFARHRPVTPADVAARSPRPETTPSTYIAPVAAAAGRFTFRVVFDRADIPDLIVRRVTRAKLAGAVIQHVCPYVDASHVVVDEQMPFCLIRSSDRTVARATFTVLLAGGVSDV